MIDQVVAGGLLSEVCIPVTTRSELTSPILQSAGEYRVPRSRKRVRSGKRRDSENVRSDAPGLNGGAEMTSGGSPRPHDGVRSARRLPIRSLDTELQMLQFPCIAGCEGIQ